MAVRTPRPPSLTAAQKVASAAIQSGDLAALQAAVAGLPLASFRLLRGDGLVHAAVRYGKGDALTWLLAQPGLDATTPNANGHTPLFMATLRGDDAMVVQLTAAGAGRTAPSPTNDELGTALLRHPLTTADTLLRHAPYYQDVAVMSDALFLAVASPHPDDAVEVLLTHGALATVQRNTVQRNPAFQLVRNSGVAPKQLVRALAQLVDHGLDLTQCDGDGSPLLHACLAHRQPALMDWVIARTPHLSPEHRLGALELSLLMAQAPLADGSQLLRGLKAVVEAYGLPDASEEAGIALLWQQAFRVMWNAKVVDYLVEQGLPITTETWMNGLSLETQQQGVILPRLLQAGYRPLEDARLPEGWEQRVQHPEVKAWMQAEHMTRTLPQTEKSPRPRL